MVAVRRRQQRNLVATLLLSQGVPMLLAGDEAGRTQRGNNNAWCQDNDVSWFDWRLVDGNADLLRFVRELVAFRRGNPTLRRRSFLQGGASSSGTLPDVEWFAADGGPIDWYAADAALTCFLGAPEAPVSAAGGEPAGMPRHLLLFANAGGSPRQFRVPSSGPIPRLSWRLFIDTSRPAPGDIHADGRGPLVDPSVPLDLAPRSLACLVADPGWEMPILVAARPG